MKNIQPNNYSVVPCLKKHNTSGKSKTATLFFLLLGFFFCGYGWSQNQSAISVSQADTLTLERCIQIALERHPVIGSEYTQVRSIYFPQIQLEAGAYLTNTPLISSNVIAPSQTIDPKGGTKFIPNLRLTLKQGIYDFGRTEKMLQAKEKLIKSAENMLESTKEDVILSVSIAYYQYVLSQQVVQINEERVKQATRHFERAGGFYQVGKIPESEVSKAELEVANAELQLIDAKGKRRLAKVSLANAMGIAETDDYSSDYPTHGGVDYHPFAENLKESIDEALSARKDMKSSEYRIKAWKNALSAAKSQYWPIITGFAGVSPYIIQKDPVQKINSDQYRVGYNMGVNFEFPLFQGLSVRADIAEAQGGIRIANSQYNILRQKIIQDVQDKYFSVKYAEEKYKATEKIIIQSEKNLKLAEGRFDTGIGSAIEITDANVSLTNSRIDRLSALYEYKMALIRFEKAVGRLSGKNVSISGESHE